MEILMIVKVSDIKNSIMEIQKHYDKHVNNKYVKKITHRIDLPQTTLQNMNLILGGSFAYIDSRGAIEDLYQGIKAVCDFIVEIQTKIIPNLDSFLNGGLFSTQQNISENEKILSQMAVKNYPMNIKILIDLLYKLFITIYEYDKTTFPNDTAYNRLEIFKDLHKTIHDIKQKSDR
jgi:hypothetical protein